jgi:hypothetical protein
VPMYFAWRRSSSCWLRSLSALSDGCTWLVAFRRDLDRGVAHHCFADLGVSKGWIDGADRIQEDNRVDRHVRSRRWTVVGGKLAKQVDLVEVVLKLERGLRRINPGSICLQRRHCINNTASANAFTCNQRHLTHARNQLKENCSSHSESIYELSGVQSCVLSGYIHLFGIL